MPSGNYHHAIETCYEAVVFPELWPKALLCHSLGSTAAMFYPKDVNQNATQVPSSSIYGEFLEDYVAGHWYENHYRAERGWPLLCRGKSVVIEHDLATDEERKKLPHYNELYLRWGFPGFAAVGFKVDQDLWCLPLIRSHKEGFFTPEEAVGFLDLQPHLTRMMKLAGLFDRSRNINSLESFDRTGARRHSGGQERPHRPDEPESRDLACAQLRMGAGAGRAPHRPPSRQQPRFAGADCSCCRGCDPQPAARPRRSSTGRAGGRCRPGGPPRLPSAW